ncbi:Calcium ion binding [Mactra antiquata]
MGYIRCVIIWFTASLCCFNAQQLQCDTANDWQNHFGAKCYKIFTGNHRRSYEWAQAVCKSYGSRLVTLKDQAENDVIGARVSEAAGRPETFYIGLSRVSSDSCLSCPELRWSNGEATEESIGFWSDNQPDDDKGDCVFVSPNKEQYCYDRPYTWNYGNCLSMKSFVCEKMAAPQGSFHCFRGGYVSQNKVCNGINDCMDGYDELNCAMFDHYYLGGSSGTLTNFLYQNAKSYTWAIETPVGTNAYVKFQNIDTEYSADFIEVYIGSIIETEAKRIDRISGQYASKNYRSYNNMMLIKFSTDSVVVRGGFQGTYHSLELSQGNRISLEARNSEWTDYSLQRFNDASFNTFLSQNDYVITIEAEDNFQLGPMITVEIEDVNLNKDDVLYFFDGETPSDPLLSTYCHGDDCNQYTTVYSTGRSMSILLRTFNGRMNDNVLRFRYRQGCYFSSNAPYGTIFTPGFINSINYPNYVKCTWSINVGQPIAIYFDSNSQLRDEDFDRKINGDFLEMMVDGEMKSGSSPLGLITSDIRGETFRSNGSIELSMMTSPTRSARGFMATWSIDCPNPNYDEFAQTNEVVYHYTSSMVVTCANGYDFHQEQIPSGTTSVTLECGFMGKWKTYRVIPRCTRKYCGPVPSISNGFVASSTGVQYMDTVTYDCFQGSTLQPAFDDNDNVIDCMANGQWTARPTCTARVCPNTLTTIISNGQGTGSGNSIGTIYRYICDGGYKIVGDPEIICQEDGTWSQNSEPTCTRLKCLLPPIMNGAYNGYQPGNLINFEQTVTFSCNPNYMKNDPTQTITCQAGQYVSSFNDQLCVNINECDNSPCDMTCVDTDGGFYCECDDGYRLHSDGTTCIDINECAEGSDVCDDVGSCLDQDGSYRCACSDPYQLFTEDGTSEYYIPIQAGENGLLSTDTYHINYTCVLRQCDTPPTVENGVLLTKRTVHRFSDHIEYQCNIGYQSTSDMVLQCGQDGNWIGTVPTCNEARCNRENPGPLENPPAYVNDLTYSYNYRLDLNCSRGDGDFQRHRFCVYDNGNYVMQGSPYECDEVDCGVPEQYPGTNNYIYSSTKYNAQFEFTCADGSRAIGTTSEGSESTVKCLASGYWDFGNLQCTGLSCTDPGHPLRGDIVATSFADQSQVTFTCDKEGYTLTNDAAITCVGSNFNGAVPQCIDTTAPVIHNCPSESIDVPKYALLRNYLPVQPIRATDNTGIERFYADVPNVNSTYNVVNNLTITYTATDFDGRSTTCQLDINVEDTVPPSITCPPLINVRLDTTSDSETVTLERSRFTIVDNRDSIHSFTVSHSIPDPLTYNHLYETYTYVATVTDTSGNADSCRGQVFVQPSECSELSFLNPLNSAKTCTRQAFSGDLVCEVVCDTGYTFTDGKRKTIRCDATDGTWDTPWIPACVVDTLKPGLTCPSSSFVYLSEDGDSQFVDFSSLSYTATDLNDIDDDSVQFSPSSYTFTKTDLYQRKSIFLSVSDIAGNTETCSFEYTALPLEGSPLALTKPIDSDYECTRRESLGVFVGWDCTITCRGTKILRGIGPSKTVRSFANTPWTADSRFPTCIADTIAPTITTCPSSQIETISASNEERVVNIDGNVKYAGAATDLNSYTITYSDVTITLRPSDLYTTKDITMFATDAAGNVNTCIFQILVQPEECSELAFRRPNNADTNCSYNSFNDVWTCDVECFNGYSFYDDGGTQRRITNCAYVPDCVNNNVFVPQQFIATMQYDYVPKDINIQTVDPNCISYYSQVVANEYFFSMATRLYDICFAQWKPMENFEVHFLPASTQGDVVAGRKVIMTYKYSMFYSDNNILNLCVAAHNSSINVTLNTYPLRNDIQGTTDCPTLEWNENAFIASSDYFCSIPFYQTADDTCRRCPPGTQSDSVTCNLCSVGSYNDGTSNLCQSCPLGWTTLAEGSTSLNDCLAPCSNGKVSFNGYEPCYSCPVGTYASDNTTCTSCDPGFTTQGRGSDSSSQCVVESVPLEPCSIGTQPVSGSDGVCELCPIGTYRSTTSQQLCAPCQNSLQSTYVVGAISNTQCYSRCLNGFISDSGLAPCRPCEKGEYWFNSTYCMPCGTGTTTEGEGSSLSSQCVSELNFRVACPRGTERDSNGICVKCEIGTYNRFENGACQSCPIISSSYFPGAVNEGMCRNKCPPGFFNSVNGLTPCSPCGSGQYSSEFGATSCDQCNNDQITYTETSTSSNDCIDPCPAGYFSHNGYGRGNECTPCPANYYQNSAGSTSCVRCPSNTASSTIGLTTLNGCIESTICTDNNPCVNGACDFRNNEVVCDCDAGTHYGRFCENTVNLCLSDPCYNNGVCTPTLGSYTCDCQGFATGTNCENLIRLCDANQTPTCQNGGHCINYPGYTTCMCRSGYSGDICEKKSDICEQNPCNIVGTDRCIDVSLDSDLIYFCECNPGYEGKHCENEINECLSTPCVNGGECVDQLNDFLCDCPTGYSGTYCQNRIDFCSNRNCGLSDDTQASCVDRYAIDEYMCLCNKGYSYDDTGFVQYSLTMGTVPSAVDTTQPIPNVDNLMDCRDTCTQAAQCVAFSFDNSESECYIWFISTDMNSMMSVNYPLYNKHVNYPDDDFWSLRYSVGDSVQATINDLRDDYGIEVCAGTDPLESRCCPVGQDCNIEGAACNFLTLNNQFEIQFKCSVSRVYDSNQCSRKTDYCMESPCQNNGNCINELGGYRCICPNGYSGKNCQTNVNECANNPCVNGECIDDIGFYTCDCDDKYSGTNCNIPVNNCSPNPCSEQGTESCNSIPGVGFTCNCRSGWEGETCTDRIQICDRDLCAHGTCSLTLDSLSRSYFQCTCEDGWEGELCDQVIDYCNVDNFGTECQGNCHNVFKRYFCECPPNVFGTNCENQPTPCITYPKCINGQCSYNGTMHCDCPPEYTGDACHIRVDYCGQTNPCMHGSTCENTDSYYRCICPEGYTGPNCEDMVDYCDGVFCSGGTCINRRDGYVCRCPLGRTGANCNREIDSNYDLYFNHPQGYGFAWVPFSVEVENTARVSVTAWVRYAADGGSGVYMTQFLGNDLETARKLMEFYEDGVRLYIPGNSPGSVTYKSNAVLNDGDWHHVIVVYKLDVGSVTLYLDTIKQGTYQASGLINMDNEFRMWVVLGCEFDNENHRCDMDGQSFHGYLSQVHWYKMELTFDASPGSGISYNFAYPRIVFDSDDMSDVILVWHEYVLESGVTRMIGSEASGDPCDTFNRSPPCNLYQVTNLPRITNCPDDIHVYSAERTKKITWTEPTFSNIGGGGVIPPTMSPGSTFEWGVYDMLYIAYDESNNYDYCSFRIYVQVGDCEDPVEPFGGRQSCDVDTLTDRKACTISCLNSANTDYMIDRDHPNLFTCGPSGSWNAKKPFCKFRYPACGAVTSAPNYEAYVRVTYNLSTSACLAVKNHFEFRTKQMLNLLNGIYGNNLCLSPDCSDVRIVITCNNLQGTRKRQVNPVDFMSLIELFITASADSTVLDGETVSLEEFLTYFIVGNGTLDFDDTTISGDVERENYAIVVGTTCPEGRVLLDGSCVQCGPGNYYRVGDDNVAYCDDCPIGSYQDSAGMNVCINCSAGFTTELAGNYEASACKVSCDLGEYFSNTLNRCEPCAVGYYQDETGQFRCKHCPAGSTTRETGSESRDECSTSCEDGYELNITGQCEACAIGYYRNATLHQTCQACDSRFITPGEGSVNVDACNIVACSPGNYRDVANNICQPCDFAYYQPEKWQTSCLPCNNDLSNWLTLSKGSSQFSDCKYYCPSGFEVESVGNCVKCPIGTYKDNADGKLEMCQTCSGNYRTADTGSTSSTDCTIYKCPVGYKPNDANTNCVECPIGTFQNVSESTSCKLCPDGTSTRQNASDSHTLCESYCPSGQEKVGDNCIQCPKGKYKDNDIDLFGMCVECDSSFTTEGLGSEKETDCSVLICQAGTKRNPTETACIDCPIGTYQPQALQDNCLICPQSPLPTSTRDVKSDSLNDCETYCDSGYEKIGSQCFPCDIGYYKNNAVDGVFASCQLCPTQYITSTTASTSISACNVANCSAGTYRTTGNTCAYCEIGSYQDEKWQQQCKPCTNPDTTTENEGADDISDCILECAPGYEDIGGSCRMCAIGYYKPNPAAAACTQCDPGFITENEGSISDDACIIPACPRGQYLDRSNAPNLQCELCPYNTYQDQVWQDECEQCTGSRSFTLERGSEEFSDCLTFCQSGFENDGQNCVSCPIGYYRDSTDPNQRTCQMCPLNRITLRTQSTSSADCSLANCTAPGTYRNPVSNTCEPCPLGSYLNEKWQTECITCPSGNYTTSTGSTSIDDCKSVCPLGEYVNANNQCEKCDFNSYKDDIDADSCTECPNGLLTVARGADSIDDCSLSPCQPGEKYILHALTCVKCETGSYQPAAGQFQCTDCPGTRYTSIEGATSVDDCRSECEVGQQFNLATRTCEPCPSGTYQPSQFQFTCLPCPANRLYSVPGATSANQCYSYCAPQASNECSVNATCALSSVTSEGYTCTCFNNYDDTGAKPGRECAHTCDRGYCKNGGTCNRSPGVSCSCTEWYSGDRCESRLSGDKLSDNTRNIIIPAAIAAGGALLLLIILAVCCLCWKKARKSKSRPPQYSEFNGDRMEKVSVHSYGQPFYGQPQMLMLAPTQEIAYDQGYPPSQGGVIYDNPGYKGESAVYQA